MTIPDGARMILLNMRVDEESFLLSELFMKMPSVDTILQYKDIHNLSVGRRWPGKKNIGKQIIMKKLKPTNKPLVKYGRVLKIEMIFEEIVEEQTMSFHEFVYRIVW